jgi:hypothetical protein
MKSILLLGLALTLLSPTAPAGSASEREAGAGGNVVGTVLTRAGVAVPGAHVLLQVELPSGRLFSERTQTDANGHFGFRDVPPGPGCVKAGHPRVGRDHVRVDVQRGQTSRVQLVLHR